MTNIGATYIYRARIKAAIAYYRETISEICRDYGKDFVCSRECEARMAIQQQGLFNEFRQIGAELDANRSVT
jgi:hypothetical protein